ncbi:MAG TPA: leukotoxin LktA family filamentous adhesin, partial [Burkholderiales bacterium]
MKKNKQADQQAGIRAVRTHEAGALRDESRRKHRIGTGWIPSRSPLAHLVALALGAGASVPVAAQIVTNSRTATTVTTVGSVTDVTTATTRGVNAFNAFSQFVVNGGHTANLHLPGSTQNLINLVDSKTQINGTLNSLYSTGKIGGNVFFASPQGFVVGAGGVVNVGKLAVSTPTAEYMQQLVDSNFNDAAIANAIMDGTAPQSSDGLITIQGKVNALDSVVLRSKSVSLDAGGQIIAGQAAVAPIAVNVGGAAVTGLAANEAGRIEIVAEAATVAGALTADRHSFASGGGILITATETIGVASTGQVKSVAAIGNASGAADVEIKAVNTVAGATGANASVNVAGLIEGGNVKLTAQATDEQGSGQATANASVTLSGTIKAKNIDAKADATASSKYTNDLTDMLVTTGIGALTGINLSTVAADADANVTIASGASLEATEEITLHANATRIASTPAINFATGKVGAAAVLGDLKGETKVQVASGANVEAGGNLVAKATSENEIDVSAYTITSTSGSYFAGTLAYAQADVTTQADIAAGAAIKAGNISIQARNENSFSTTATAMANGDGVAGAAAAISDIDVHTSATLGANLNGANGTGNLTVLAENYTESNKTSASATTGSGAVMRMMGGAAGAAGNFIQTKVGTVSDKVGNKVDGNAQNPGSALKIAAAVTVADVNLDAKAGIADNTQIDATGDVAVLAKLEDAGVRNNAKSEINAQVDKGDGKVAVSAGVAIGEFNHIAEATIGDNVRINAKHIGVGADVKLPITITWHKWEGLDSILPKLNTNLGLLNEVLTSYASASGDSSGVGLFGSTNYFASDNNVRAWVGKGSTLTATGNRDDWTTSYVDGNGDTKSWVWNEAVDLQARSLTESIDIAGNLNFLNPVSGTSSGAGGVSVGAAFNWIDHGANTIAGIGDGVTITTSGLGVNATADDRMIVVSPTSGSGGGFGGNGIVALSRIDNTTHASISNEANITADAIVLDAAQGLSVWSAAGSLSREESAAVGIAVAVNDVTTDTKAYIGDNDEDSPSGTGTDGAKGTITTDSLSVNAITDGMVGTFAVAGAVAKSDDPNAEPGLIDRTKTKISGKVDGLRNAAASKMEGLPLLGKLADKVRAAEKAPAESKQPTKPPFGIGVSGASSVNISSMDTSAFIDGVTINSRSAGQTDVLTRAVTNADLISGAGGAALAAAKNPSAKFSAGVAGAVAFNQLDNDTYAGIKNATINDAGEVKVQALSAGDQISVGLGIALNTSQDQSKAGVAAGSVSLTTTDNSTKAEIVSSTIKGDGSGTDSVDVTAYDRARIANGGGTFTYGGRVGVGAAVSFAQITNSTEAIIDGGQLTNLDSVGVSALSASRIVNAAAMGGYGAESNSLTGAFVITDVSKDVIASVRNGAQLTTDGNVSLVASGVGRDGDLDVLLHPDRNNDVSFSLDRGAAEAPDADQIIGDGRIGVDRGGEAIIGVAGQLSVGKNNLGLSFVGQTIHNTYEAVIESATVNARGDVKVTAQDTAQITGVAAGIGGATDKFAGMGSAVANVTVNKVEARIGAEDSTAPDTSVTGANIEVKAKNTAEIYAGAGNIAASKNTALGAAVAHNQTTNSTKAVVNDATLDAGAGNVLLDAASHSSIWGLAASGALAGTAAIGGSLNFNLITDTVQAKLSDTDVSGGSLSVTARDRDDATDDRSSIWSLAGNISGAGKGAIGGAVSSNTVANTIDAAINDSTLTIDGDTEVDAASGSDIWSMAVAGAAAGPVAANGSVAVNTLANTTTAKVSGGSVTAGNLNVTASERNDATDERSSIWALAGAVSGAGKAAVAGASAINTIANNLDAQIENASVDVGTGGVTVETQAGAEIKSAAVAGGGAGVAAVTGSVAVNTIASQATAKASNASITAGTLAIKAHDIKSDGSAGSLIQSLAGNVNGAGTVSVGIATAVNTISNRVEAGVDGSTLIVSTATTVDAKEKAKIETLAADGGGAGTAAVGGSATVNDIANTTKAGISNSSNVGAANKTSIAASDSSSIDSIAGAIRIAGQAGVGAAASINRVGNTVDAYLSGNKSGNAYQAKNVVLDAASDATIRTIAVGVAGGGMAGVAGSVATNILDTSVTSHIDGGAKVQADNNVGVLAENQDKIEVAAGAAGIGGANAGVALSTVVNVIESQTKASISGTTTEVTALGKDASDTLTVNTGELVSAPNIGETPDAASFAWYDLQGKTRQASGVAVNAFSTQQVGSIAASIGATLPNPKGSGAVGATAGVNVLAGATEAYVDGAKINKTNAGAAAAQDVDIRAGSHSYSTDFVAGASVSGDVAMGGAIDTTVISRATRAYAKNADITASDDVVVAAQSSQGARAMGASAGGAIAGGAGTAVVGVISGTTEAYLDTTAVKSIDLDVNATSRSGINLMGGALAVGGGAVGGAFAVGVSDQTTRAYIKNGQADVSGNIGVKADADTRFWNVAVSGAAGGMAVAGMAAVNVVSNTTEAYLDGAKIGTSGAKANAVTVSAEDDVQVRSYGGALGAGFAPGVGAGAAANVTVVQSRVGSEVKNSNVYAANALDVKALSSVDAEHVTAAAGGSMGSGLAGSASLILLGNGTSGSAMSELNKDNNGVLKKIFDLSSGEKVSETDGLDQNQKDALNNSDVQASRDELANRDATRGARLGNTELSLSGGPTGELQAVNDRGSYDTSRHFASNADADVTRAAITGGTINAGSVSVTAEDKSRTSNVAGAAGAGFGTVGVGGGVAITRVYNDVQAVLAAANLSSGNVTLAAKAVNGSGDAASATAYAGGAGPVGLGAAWADAYVENDVVTSIGGSVNASGAVSVDAQDTTSAKADSIGAAAGAGAAGISVAMAEKKSGVSASAGGTISNATSLDVAALSAGSVSSKSIAAAGGLFAAGTGAGADAFDRSVVRAYIADNASIKVNGTTEVEATAKPQTKAEAYGVAVSGGLSIGASVAKAEADADVAAYVGNLANVTTDNLDVIARSLEPDAGQTAYAKAIGGSGGYLFGANATVADASSSNTVASYVHDGASVTVPGIVNVAATNNSEQDAEAFGIAAGIIAAGANVATARSNSSTDAHFDGHLTGTAAQISVTANGDDDNFAKAIAGSGGVIAGHAATAGTTNTSTTTAELQRAGSDSTIKAATLTVDAAHMARFNAEVDSVNAAVVGASAAITNHTVNTDTDAAIGAGAKVETLNVTVKATDTIRKDWLSDYNVRAAGGGIASGAAASGNVTVTQSTDASVGAGAALKVVGSRNDAHLFDIAAINDFEIRDKVKLDTGGVIAVAAANNRIDVTDSQANVTIGNGATLDSVGGINLYAKTHGRAEAHANAKTYGLAGAAEGDSKALITASQTIGVGSNASLRADGEIRLGAGRTPDGTPNDIYATALTDTWNKAAAPISILSATGRVNETATIDLAATSKLRGVTDITLLAEKGELGGTGRYTGMDLYRKAAQEAANAVGKLVGGGESSWELKGGTSTTNGASSVVVNGLVESGIQNEQFLTIGWNKDTQTHYIKRVSDEGITYTVTEDMLAQSFQQRLDQLYALRDEHAGNTDAVTAYNLEIQRIESQLRALTGSGGSNFASRDVVVKFIDVAPILAAAGNIRIEGGSLGGSGKLISPGDAKIEVINETPYFLRVSDLIIPDQPGGLIKFNGSTITDNASINDLNPGKSGANFNQVITGANSPAPSIVVKSTFDPNAVGSGAPVGTVAPDIYVSGDVRNLQGTVTVQAVAGSVVADGVINAKTINLSAGRDFVLGYTEGFRHIGGSPEGLWGDITRKLETGEYVLYQDDIYSTILIDGVRVRWLKIGSRASRSSSGSLVAGNNVYISGRYLNINGTIQSGLPDWNLSIGNLDSQITNAEKLYAERLARGNADPYIQLLNWSQGNDPNNTRKVTAWWNAKEDRIELDG